MRWNGRVGMYMFVVLVIVAVVFRKYICFEMDKRGEENAQVANTKRKIHTRGI